MPAAELAFHKLQLRRRKVGLSNAADQTAQLAQMNEQERQLAAQLGVTA